MYFKIQDKYCVENFKFIVKNMYLCKINISMPFKGHKIIIMILSEMPGWLAKEASVLCVHFV